MTVLNAVYVGLVVGLIFSVIMQVRQSRHNKLKLDAITTTMLALEEVRGILNAWAATEPDSERRARLLKARQIHAEAVKARLAMGEHFTPADIDADVRNQEDYYR